MAISGSFKTSAYEGRHLVLSWERTGFDLGKNQTTIKWTLKGAGGSNVWYMSGNFKVTIDGKTVYSSATRIQLSSGTTVASGSVTLTHNTDGSRSFKASAEAGIYSYAVNCTGFATFTLDPLARASQPSCITWPEHTQNVGSFGDTIAIHMNRAADVYTHTVRYAFGSQTGTIATGVSTGTTWTIPKSLMNLIPTAEKGSGTIYVDTYRGSTLVGTKYCGFTATVPTTPDCYPSGSFTLTDTSTAGEIYGSPVQGLSRIQVKVNPALAYGSPVDSCVIEIDGGSYAKQEATSGLLQKAGDSIVKATIRDKRGRSGVISYTMKVQAYTKPNISKLTVHRCDADGTQNEQGEYIKAVFSAAISSLGAKNTATYNLQYKKGSATSYSSVTLSALANTYTVTDHAHVFAADGNSPYDVRLVAKDRHHTTSRDTQASTAFSLLNFGANGTSIGAGMVAGKANALEVGLESYFYGSTIQTGNKYTASSPGIAGTGGYVRMARLTITAANADTPIAFVFTQRQKLHPMTVYVQFRNADATTSTLQKISYEGANYGAFLVQNSPLVWDLYLQKGSNYDTITLQEWYTSKTMESRVDVTFPGDLVSSLPGEYYRATPAQLQSLLDYIYPVGSVYISYSHNDPAAMFGGVWQRISNAFLWAVDANGEIGLTGGEKTHKLTLSETPSHTHGAVYSAQAEGDKTLPWFSTGVLGSGDKIAYGGIYVGGGQAHNNMPPYVQVSMWRRTA